MDTDCEVVLLKCVKFALQSYDCQLQNVQWSVKMFDEFFFISELLKQKVFFDRNSEIQHQKAGNLDENFLLTFYIRKDLKNFKIH